MGHAAAERSDVAEREGAEEAAEDDDHRQREQDDDTLAAPGAVDCDIELDGGARVGGRDDGGRSREGIGVPDRRRGSEVGDGMRRERCVGNEGAPLDLRHFLLERCDLAEQRCDRLRDRRFRRQPGLVRGDEARSAGGAMRRIDGGLDAGAGRADVRARAGNGGGTDGARGATACDGGSSGGLDRTTRGAAVANNGAGATDAGRGGSADGTRGLEAGRGVANARGAIPSARAYGSASGALAGLGC